MSQAAEVGLADRYHVRVLKTPKEVRRAIAYVLLNASRHAAALGRKRRGGADPASSGAWFDGWKPGPKPGPGAGAERPPPVAAARSWLLRVGWRRHGLVRASEVPGVKSAAERLERLRDLPHQGLQATGGAGGLVRARCSADLGP